MYQVGPDAGVRAVLIGLRNMGNGAVNKLLIDLHRAIRECPKCRSTVGTPVMFECGHRACDFCFELVDRTKRYRPKCGTCGARSVPQPDGLGPVCKAFAGAGFRIPVPVDGAPADEEFVDLSPVPIDDDA